MADAVAKKQILLALRGGRTSYRAVLDAYAAVVWLGRDDTESLRLVVSSLMTDLLLDGFLDIAYGPGPALESADSWLTAKGLALLGTDALPRTRPNGEIKRRILCSLRDGRLRYSEARAADSRRPDPNGRIAGDSFEELIAELIADGFVTAEYKSPEEPAGPIEFLSLTAKATTAFAAGL